MTISAMLSQLFFAALRAWFDKENIRCPINRVSQPGNEDDWLVLSLDHSLMGKPSYECMSVAQQGYYSLNGEKLHPGVFHGDGVRPEFFFHGTDMEALCLILSRGTIMSSGELGQQKHTPDGVYSFGLQQRSSASSYVFHGGVQIVFESPGCVMTMSNSAKFAGCPPGVILRSWRTKPEWGAVGREWIHNSSSIRVAGVRVLPGMAKQWVQSRFAFQDM